MVINKTLSWKFDAIYQSVIFHPATGGCQSFLFFFFKQNFSSNTCHQDVINKMFVWQHFVCEATYIPALTSLTAQSPGLTPFKSPSGPMHRVAATGFLVVFKT